MNEHKEILTAQLKRLIYDIGIGKVTLAEKNPEVPVPREILLVPRIIIPLSGEKELLYTANKQVVQEMLQPGEALFVPSLCCTRTRWTSPHEMISIVMHKNMLRILYINNHGYDDSSEMRPIPDAFSHIKYYQEATSHIFKTLSTLKSSNSQCLINLVECLLMFSLEDLKQNTSSDNNPWVSCAAWPWIIEYIHNNITEDITRDHVAKRFSLTPQYISRLFQKNTRSTFKAYITAERMKRATELLTGSNLTVDEISWECGYPYTSYFIRIFRKHYNVSPGTFRRNAARQPGFLDGQVSSE